MRLDKLFSSTIYQWQQWQQILISLTIIILLCLSLHEITAGIKFLYKKQEISPLIQKTDLKTKTVNNVFLTTPLFGVYAAQSYATLKKTKLDIELVGILYSKDKKQSQALISMGNNQEKLYFVGNHLSQGATIKKITPLEVIILYNGELERLALRKD